ncbi:hypothetical protein TrLO_g4953 [Triparma laevis f. longispina]|uniref:Uncharacterized protein n=1 Tax=Triparma laevis f. longispina TaxID=1714387 RepID=A0A9W7FRY4_9STRA|nr:hypothetical protein TrLO_g4953 [Triparma laevis f. longispina]
MSNMVPLLTDSNILTVGIATVASTCMLTYFATFSTPDTMLLLLLILCIFGNYAWIQHIESGWGSQNALNMFQCSLLIGIFGFLIGLYRRLKYPELIVDSDDEEDDDEIDEKLSKTFIKLKDIDKKSEVTENVKKLGLSKRADLKDKMHIVNHMHTMKAVKEGGWKERTSSKKKNK